MSRRKAPSAAAGDDAWARAVVEWDQFCWGCTGAGPSTPLEPSCDLGESCTHRPGDKSWALPSAQYGSREVTDLASSNGSGEVGGGTPAQPLSHGPCSLVSAFPELRKPRPCAHGDHIGGGGLITLLKIKRSCTECPFPLLSTGNSGKSSYVVRVPVCAGVCHMCFHAASEGHCRK